MRLINAKTLELDDFSQSQVPPYAILSHTWGEDEVANQDMSLPGRSSKRGYAKIVQTCRLARSHDLEHIWVDTCCIDKSSSAELTESINSMFQWYKNAIVCYAFLEDLSPDQRAEELIRCRWFSRGWTLQEMLAPEKVEFYDMNWTYRGSRFDFKDVISHSTRIPLSILNGEKVPLESYSVATRMSWAARRQTTRVEDLAYCLLGIFNVNMALIYGEGHKAFRRLQEEIIKRSNDLTIFAWDLSEHQKYPLGLFATSPAVFTYSSTVIPFDDDFQEFSVTNKGLLFSGDVPLRAITVTENGSGHQIKSYFLCLGTITHSHTEEEADGGICLRKIGPRLFYRDGKFPLQGFGRRDWEQVAFFEVKNFYIIIDPAIAKISSIYSSFRKYALHVPTHDVFHLVDTVPETLWDLTDRVFLRPNPYGWTRYPMLIGMAFNGMLAGRTVDIIIICDFRDTFPNCKLFDRHEHSHLAELIFDERHRSESLLWTKIESKIPSSEILVLGSSMEFRVGKTALCVSASFNRQLVKEVSTEVELYTLNLSVAECL